MSAPSSTSNTRGWWTRLRPAVISLLAALSLSGIIAVSASTGASANTGSETSVSIEHAHATPASTTGTETTVAVPSKATPATPKETPVSVAHAQASVASIEQALAPAPKASPRCICPPPEAYLPMLPNVNSVYQYRGGGWKLSWFNVIGSNPGNGSEGLAYVAYAKNYRDRTYTLSVTPDVNNQRYIVYSLTQSNGRFRLVLIKGRINTVQHELYQGSIAAVYVGSSFLFYLSSTPNDMPEIYGGVSYGGCVAHALTPVYTYNNFTLVGVTWKRGGASINAFALTGIYGSGANVWVIYAYWQGSTPVLRGELAFGKTGESVALNARTNAVGVGKPVNVSCRS